MPTPEKHALLGASSAARWLACPPSARLCENKPDRNTKYTEEGRLAHSLGELKLRKLFGTGTTPMKPSVYKKELAAIKADPMYSAEMESCTEEYLDHIQATAMEYKQRPMVAFEQMVDYSAYAPEGYGTADCILLTPTDIHVCDYKHGQGVPVDATENPQLKLYALGALNRYAAFYPDVEKVFLHIIQPRAGGISVWETTVAALRQWGEEVVKPRAALAWAGEGEFAPGEHQCRFCKIRNTCRARAQTVQEVAALPDFGKLPPELTDAEVGEALALGERVADWLEKLKSYAAGAIEQGKEIRGYKLVAGRTSRAWDDQTKAFADMQAAGVAEAMLYERTPLTVAKTEKMLGKKRFGEIAVAHVVQTPGKPTLVPESDKRTPWSAAATDFAGMIKGADTK